MKRRFNILSDPRFRLVYGDVRSFREGFKPRKLRLNREQFELLPDIKKKTQVYPGMLLAEHPSLEKGDLHAPVYGVISDINVRSIFIDVFEDAAVDASAFPAVERVELLNSELRGEDLVLAVKKLGVNTRSLGQRARTLVINGLNPEPGITWAEAMLIGYADEIKAGIELMRRFGRADEIILAVPKGAVVHVDGIRTVEVEPEYPNSISQLLIKQITKKENPEGWASVGIHNVWSLGRVALTGLPLMETVITVNVDDHWANYIVTNGSIVGDLIEYTDVELKDGDTILRGGPLRGESLDQLDRSITKGTQGFFIVRKGTIPEVEGDSICVNCGACMLVCSARIDPRMLSRYAEFNKYGMSRKENFHLCVDCGLCSYVCIARRPVLQYIRLAVNKLRQEEAMAKLTPIVPVSKD